MRDDARRLAELAAHAWDTEAVTAAMRAARAESAPVAALPEDEVRRHVQALVDVVRASFVAPEADIEPVCVVAERLGADRARQGVPVEALLAGVQAGRSAVRDRMLALSREHSTPVEAVLDAVIRADDLTATVVQRMIHAHRIAELEAARTSRDRGTQTLRRLLLGESTAPAPLSAHTHYHCLVSDISDPDVAARLESRLTAQVSGLCGLVDGRLAALLTGVPAIDPDAGLLVVTPAVALADVPAHYTLARRALRAARTAGRTGAQSLTDLALLTVTHAEPRLGALLAAAELAGLDVTDPFHRDLAATALAHLEHGGRVDRTAAALHVHPNTVKYRLRRLDEICGTTTDSGADVVAATTRRWWALRHWLTTDPQGAGVRSAGDLPGAIRPDAP